MIVIKDVNGDLFKILEAKEGSRSRGSKNY